jgi:hypothetical protein
VLTSNECCWAEEAAPVETEKKEKLYIAGSMSGHDDFNFPLFFKAEEFLSSQGYDVVNPARLDCDAGFPLERLKQLNEAEFKEFLNGATKRDLDALQGCDGIVMLPGWEDSKGARAEKAVAEWMHKQIKYLNKDAGDGEGAGDWWLEWEDWWLEWEGEKKNEAPQPDAGGWIAHKPGDPMPCDGELLVDVKIQNGLKPKGKMASCFSWGDIDEHGIGGVNITAWRPHQPQPNADSWIPHVPGDPMPCSGSTIVDVKLQNGSTHPSVFDARNWDWGAWEDESWSQIIAWRPSQPQPKQPYNSDERAEWGVEQPKFHPNDPKGAAGAKKCPMHLLPPVALEQIAWVMGLGASKYGDWNFIEADVCASTYIGALLRHWSEFAKGVDIDPESGLPHLAHVAANCAIVLTAQQQGALVDDRPKLKNTKLANG